jgi:hypothetical protein
MNKLLAHLHLLRDCGDLATAFQNHVFCKLTEVEVQTRIVLSKKGLIIFENLGNAGVYLKTCR